MKITNITCVGGSLYKVTILFNRKYISGFTYNTKAVERVNATKLTGRQELNGLTYKQAERQLVEDVKIVNNINEKFKIKK